MDFSAPPPGCDAVIPVHVVSGALGSGKTTILSRLLAANGLRSTAIIVNEFAKISIDHLLLPFGKDDEVIPLAGGCLCCQSHADFLKALHRLALTKVRSAGQSFEQVAVETSGLARADEVFAGIRDDSILATHFIPGLVIACVDPLWQDGLTGAEYDAGQAIACADKIVITKADLALPGQVKAAMAAARAINPVAEIIDACAVDGKLDMLLSNTSAPSGILPFAQNRHRNQEGHKNFLHAISSFVIEREEALSLEAVSEWLTALTILAPASVLRIKGFVALQGHDKHVLVQAVGSVLHPPVAVNETGLPNDRSLLVFIVRGLDREMVEAMLDLALSRQTMRSDQVLPGLNDIVIQASGDA
jgi:G3E family GTPase